MQEDLVKPMRLLLYEGKYALASITTIMTGMAFLMALSIRGMTSACISYALNLPEASYELCIGGAIEGIVTFLVVLIVCIVILKTFVKVSEHTPNVIP